MKNQVLIFLVLLPALLHSQERKDIILFPEKDGAVVYEGIVDMPNLPKDQIFNNAVKFVAINAGDSKNVNRVNDKETGQIILKGNLPARIKKGLVDWSETVNLTLQIDCKDNRYRYRLFNISFDLRKGTAEDRNKEALGEKTGPIVKRWIPVYIAAVDTEIKSYIDKMVKDIAKNDDF